MKDRLNEVLLDLELRCDINNEPIRGVACKGMCNEIVTLRSDVLHILHGIGFRAPAGDTGEFYVRGMRCQGVVVG